MSQHTLFETECRDCGKEVRTVAKTANVADLVSGVIIKCSKCGTTNRTDDSQPVGVDGAVVRHE